MVAAAVMHRAVLVAGCAMALACSKSSLSDAGSAAPSASVLILEPLPDPEPAAPEAAAAEAAAPRVAPPSPPGLGYTDGDDLPADAGDDGRCPATPSTTKPREIVVRLEHVTQPRPSIDLVIAGLSVRKRLWPSVAGNVNPNSCSTDARRDSLVFWCSEVMTGTTGKVYARGNDVVLGHATTEGTKQTRYRLPCGSTARFERSACPARCYAHDEDHCECSELADTWRGTPRPTPTASAR